MTELYFAGGCFWGVEAYFKKLRGVIDTSVGYANGNIENPTYQMVCDGTATHSETVHVVFDERVLPIEKLLKHYISIIDPYSLNQQGNDKGIQYRTGIYSKSEQLLSQVSHYLSNTYQDDFKLFSIEIKRLEHYYLAEEYHQDYLSKNPHGYCHINLNTIDRKDLKE